MGERRDGRDGRASTRNNAQEERGPSPSISLVEDPIRSPPRALRNTEYTNNRQIHATGATCPRQLSQALYARGSYGRYMPIEQTTSHTQQPLQQPIQGRSRDKKDKKEKDRKSHSPPPRGGGEPSPPRSRSSVARSVEKAHYFSQQAIRICLGEFIPSNHFTGFRRGYVFQLGYWGQGYYMDREQGHTSDAPSHRNPTNLRQNLPGGEKRRNDAEDSGKDGTAKGKGGGKAGKDWGKGKLPY